MSTQISKLLWLSALGLLLTALPAAAGTAGDDALDVQILTIVDGGDCEPGDDCGGGGECEPGDDCGGGGGGECEPGDDCGGGGGGECEPGDDCGGGGGECEPGDDCGGGGGGGGGELRNVLKFDERSYFAIEGSGVAIITVERSHGEDGAVAVTYATAGGTATPGTDYTATSGTLSWPAGSGATLTFTIPLLDDGVAEGNETVELVLSNPTGGASLDPDRSTAVLTIGDQGGGDVPPGDDGGDRPGTFKFSQRGFQVIEGQGVATIGVERSHGERGAVSVAYAAAAGSAAGGEDFQEVSGILSWAAGDGATKTFQVPVFDDTAPEGTETVNLTLADPTGGAGIDPERGSALVSILDDDASTAACEPGDDRLCLQAGRFSAEITFRTPNVAGGTGRARAVPISSQAGLFWFFDAANAEMLLKVIDTCGVPGFDAYWVFYAATTNVDFTLTVTDRGTGVAKQYFNPLGRTAEPVQDVLTFACN